jgi:hypothetical protein
MTRRFALGSALGLAALIVPGVLTTSALLVAQQPPAQQPAAQQPAAPPAGQAAPGGGRGAPAGPPAPCGPKADLPGNLSANVDPKSRCFEIRMYTVDPSRDGVGQFKGGINELHQRFREKEVEIFEKHGADILGVWQRLDDPNTLVWMIVYRDRAHREQVWDAFNKDPDWTALRMKYFVPLKANTFLMSASDYSPMK